MTKFEIAMKLMAESPDRNLLPQIVIEWDGRKNGEVEHHEYVPTYRGEDIECDSLIIPLPGVHFTYTGKLVTRYDRWTLTYRPNKYGWLRVPYMKYYPEYQAMVMGAYNLNISRPSNTKGLSSEPREWEEDSTFQKMVFFKDTMEAYDANGRLGEDGRYYNKKILRRIQEMCSATKFTCCYKFLIDEWNKMNPEKKIVYAWYMVDGYKNLYPRKAAKPNPKRDAELAEVEAIMNKLPEMFYTKHTVEKTTVDGWDVWRFGVYYSNALAGGTFDEKTRMFVKGSAVYVYTNRSYNGYKWEKCTFNSAQTSVYGQTDINYINNPEELTLSEIYEAAKKKHMAALRDEYPVIYNKVRNYYDTEIGEIFNCNFKQPGVRALEKANGNVLDAIGFNRDKAVEIEKLIANKLDSWYLRRIAKKYDVVKEVGYEYSDYTELIMNKDMRSSYRIATMSAEEVISFVEFNKKDSENLGKVAQAWNLMKDWSLSKYNIPGTATNDVFEALKTLEVDKLYIRVVNLAKANGVV